MKNCTSPYAHTSNHAFIATDVVLKPLLFGVGIIGNILTIMVLNHTYLRTNSAIYVYLTGLAACELLVLMLAVPRSVRDTAVLAPETGFAKEMTQYMTYEYGFRNILKNSATWIVVFVALVRYATMKSPLKKRRLTTISASRIIVFVIVLFCLVVNFPRFFELHVMELKNHCLEKVILWDWDYTQFAKKSLYLNVYPWVIVAVAFVLPFILMVLIGTLIAMRIRILHVLRNYVSVTSAVDGNEVQINIILIAVITGYFLLELPTAIAHVLFAVKPERVQRPLLEYSNLALSVDCLSMVHACMYFILYMLISRDFRKAFRRTFCCVCITGDEYYEPMTCIDIVTCGWTYNRVPKEAVSSKASTTSSLRDQPDSAGKVPHDYETRSEMKPVKYHGPNVAKGGWI